MAIKSVAGSLVENPKEEDVSKRYIFIGADNPIIIIRVRDSSCIRWSRLEAHPILLQAHPILLQGHP